MKYLSGLLVLILFVSSSSTCNKTTGNSTCFKGKLEIKGICSNYTIRLLEGNMDTSKIESNWTDENTGKSYRNVFGIVNPCILPTDLKEGDEFYFTLDSTSKRDCTVCMAYYPTPARKLNIKVQQSPCTE
jgi:hypothetical protein